MFTVVMNNKNLTVTKYIPIRYKESNIDMLRFLIPQDYMGYDLDQFATVITFITPDGQQVCEQIYRMNDLYKGYYDFRLGFKSAITDKIGEVLACLKFASQVKEQKDGSDVLVDKIIKTNMISFNVESILPQSNNNEHINDADQMKADIMDLKSNMTAAIESIQYLNQIKADDIEIVDGKVYLVATDHITGQRIHIGEPISAVSHMWHTVEKVKG